MPLPALVNGEQCRDARCNRCPPVRELGRGAQSAPPPAATGGLGKQATQHGGSLKALAEAYRHTAAAAARLRLSACPYIGTRTRRSVASASVSGSPWASEPNSHAVGRANSPASASSSRSAAPYGSAASTVYPAACRPTTTVAGSAARTRSTWKRLPALARTHLPLYGSTASPAKTTAAEPAAS